MVDGRDKLLLPLGRTAINGEEGETGATIGEGIVADCVLFNLAPSLLPKDAGGSQVHVSTQPTPHHTLGAMDCV